MTIKTDRRPLPDDLKVTVCDACNRCCCWQGIFMCDAAYSAGTKEITVAEWRELMKTIDPGEHEDYLEADVNVIDWRCPDAD